MVIRHLTLTDYPNPVFVETGSFLGKGIAAALAAGFPRVISIELSEKYFVHCTERFKADSRVELVFGDSGVWLGKVLDALGTTPATLWLDGHWSGKDTALGPEPTPILRELSVVRPCDTILIDDVRCWQDDFDARFNGGVTIRDIYGAINQIGRYHISHVGDVLVAVPSCPG